jgi:hypothetical protein
VINDHTGGRAMTIPAIAVLVATSSSRRGVSRERQK